MTYEEFCAGTGREDVDRDFYEGSVEPVYMQYRHFPTKRDFFDFIERHGLQGIVTLARALRREGEWTVNNPDIGRAKLNRIQHEMRILKMEEDAVKLIYGIE